MIRATVSMCAALMIMSAGALPATARPASASVEFNQSLLDRWLVLYPAVLKMMKPDAAPMSDSAGQAYMERACANAGFTTYEQCAEVFGYAGMIMSACDRKSRSFRDPIKLMRHQIARIDKDASLSPEQKSRATAELKQIVARFPDDLPQAHLRLMTANRDRIFEVVLAAGADMSAQPDGRQNW